MKNRTVLAIMLYAAVALLPVGLYASELSHRKAAYDLLDSMHLNKLLAESIESMLQFELRQNPQLRPYAHVLRRFFSRYMSGESLREDFARIYMEAFSENELKKLAAFNRTPVGQKALRMAPRLMAKGAAIGQRKIQQHVGELQQMLAEEQRKQQPMPSPASP